MPRASRSAVWGIAPLALIVVALLGSVLIPARQTWRITRLLGESTGVLAPARLLQAELQSGLAREVAALQSYALFGDERMLDQYRAAAAEDGQRLAALERLADRLDRPTATRVALLRGRIDEWRRTDGARIERGGSRDSLAMALRVGQVRYDAALDAVTALTSDLSDEAISRDERVRELERLSLFSNAALVFAAFIAASIVLWLALNERRLATALERRVAEESALGRVARTLGAAESHEEALRHAAEGAVAATGASAAYVEWRVAHEEIAGTLATAGDVSPPHVVRASTLDSVLAELSASGGVTTQVDLPTVAAPLATRLVRGTGGTLAGLASPLRSSDGTLGAIVLVRRPTDRPFGDDERRQLRLVSGLAVATLRRIDGVEAERRALDDARRQARREAALRSAAEALAGAYTVDEVTHRISHAALEAVEGRGAFVEWMVGTPDDGPRTVVVRAVAGQGTPPLDASCPLEGSFTELAMTIDHPLLIADLATAERSSTCGAHGSHASAILVPLGDASSRRGALFVLGAGSDRFAPDDVARAGIFGHLAALAYEKVKLLDEAHEGRRVLERVMQSRSRLMRGFSHDVKNPIGAADGYAELLAHGIYGELSEEQRGHIERMRRCLRDALALIEDLHELARAETVELSLSAAPVDLGRLVRAIGEEYHATAAASGLTLVIDVAPGTPVVEVDEARVRQIASNLLSNAIKYTEHGTVTLRTRTGAESPSGEPGDWALVEVSDDGPGIPDDARELIFEEFSRLGTRAKPGAGLGLAISRLIAQTLGGHISVESEPGRGSTFALWLPRRGASRD